MRRNVAKVQVRKLLAAIAVALLAGACFGPPPPPTPDGITPYAPEQLAPLLPTEVNDKPLSVGEYRPADSTTIFAEAPEALRSYLLDIGKGPTDLVGATAISEPVNLPDGRPTGVYVIAIRVRGVPADQVMAGFVAKTSPQPTLRPTTIGGKQVFAVIRAAPDPLYLYAIGEALFIVGATPADVPSSEADAQAALAALP